MPFEQDRVYTPKLHAPFELKSAQMCIGHFDDDFCSFLAKVSDGGDSFQFRGSILMEDEVASGQSVIAHAHIN